VRWEREGLPSSDARLLDGMLLRVLVREMRQDAYEKDEKEEPCSMTFAPLCNR